MLGQGYRDQWVTYCTKAQAFYLELELLCWVTWTPFGIPEAFASASLKFNLSLP